MAKRVSVVLSHWHHLIEGLKHSSLDFYAKTEEAIQKRSLPEIKLSRIDYHEGGIFSAKREYLRVQRRELVFDICAAPFGSGYFVSWWLGEIRVGIWGLIALVPIFGPLFLRLFRPETYYRLDTTYMFQESVRAAILEVIDDLTKDQGLSSLTELDRKPILKELMKR